MPSGNVGNLQAPFFLVSKVETCGYQQLNAHKYTTNMDWGVSLITWIISKAIRI